MGNKNSLVYCGWVVASLTVITVVGGIIAKSRLEASPKLNLEASFGLLTIEKLFDSGDSATIDAKLSQEFSGDLAANQAAFEDGICTKEQVSDHSCLSNAIYLRVVGSVTGLRLGQDAKISIYKRDSRGGFSISDAGNLELKTVTSRVFFDSYEVTPVLSRVPFHAVIRGNKIISLEERYLP